jgi:putative addiction module component (TIGR02574 family)
MSAAERFLPDVLALPVTERAKLVHRLLESLESVPEGDLDAIWVAELERRASDVATGVVVPVSWQAARANILDELQKRRATRNTP